jgi:Abortive infection alpha
MMNLPEPIGEAALAFLQKLLGPVAEAGEILSDKVRFYRWKSSIKTIQRAREIAREHNLEIREVPLKFLVPFMEKSSLEEEDSPLLERWAVLLASSASDTSQAKTIYTDILSRLSAEDVRTLDSLVSPKFLQRVQERVRPGGLDRSIVLAMKEAEPGFHEFLRGRFNAITKSSNAMHFRSELAEFASALTSRISEPFVENVTIRFGSETPPVHRYTSHIESPSILDVLTSCGLIYRYETKINLVLAEAFVALIHPTLLGVKFVVACRGDGLKGKT